MPVDNTTADTVYTRTFRRAIETTGGVQRLASALGTSVEEIKDWADGHQIPPPGAFLGAIDIVAHAGRVPSGAAKP